MSSPEGLLAEAEAQSAAIWGRQSGAAVNRVARNYDHYRRAFDSFVDGGHAEQAARFIAALRDYWCAGAQYGEGMAWIDRVLRLAELSTESRSMVLDHAGALAFSDGKYASARRYFEASVDLRRKCDSKRALALSLIHLAAAMRWGSGDGTSAVATYKESLTLAREVGDRLLTGAALMPLGTLALDRGALDEAQALLREGLAMYLEAQLEVALPLALEQFAALAAAQGHSVRALRLAGAGAAWRHKLNTRATPYRDWLDRYVSNSRLTLDESKATSVWEAGEAMTLERAIAYAVRDESNR